MCFRLVPNLATLDDLERRNSPNSSLISPKLGSFGADYQWWAVINYFLVNYVIKLLWVDSKNLTTQK